jgi:hypothetical protein
MLRFALVVLTLALSLLPADLARAQNILPLVARTPTPPSEPYALMLWCRSHVYRRHGERRIINGKVVWWYGDPRHVTQMTDACVADKGATFRGVRYADDKPSPRKPPQAAKQTSKQTARTIRPVSPDHAAALKLVAGPPPSGGDALVKWCNMKTFGRHGRRAPEYGPGISIMPLELQAATQDACIRSKGRSF